MPDDAATDTPSFEHLLQEYFSRYLPRPLQRKSIQSALTHIMALDAVRSVLADIADLSDFAAVDALIERVGLSVNYEQTERIPPRGRLLVVANHPVGAADVFLMLQCLHRVRQDVRVVINKVGVLLVPHIAGLCLPVDRYSAFDPDARARISAALHDEQAVILFPAGGISKLTCRGIRDHRWKHGAVHFIRECAADVLPVHIAGRSSRLFLSLPRTLRHFLVTREMLHPVRQHITVRIGSPIPHGELTTGDIDAATQRLQQTVYALGA